MLSHKLIVFAVLSLVLLQLHQVNSEASVDGCKNNFTLVGDKCLLVVRNSYNWYEAERNCHSMGAGLLSLQSQSQLQQINKWLTSVIKPYMIDFWTSGNTLGGQKGTYYWQSTGEIARYLPWSSGQPQPIADCLLIYSTNSVNADYGLWIYNCSLAVASICEHQPQKFNTRICLKPGSYEIAQVLA